MTASFNTNGENISDFQEMVSGQKARGELPLANVAKSNISVESQTDEISDVDQRQPGAFVIIEEKERVQHRLLDEAHEELTSLRHVNEQLVHEMQQMRWDHEQLQQMKENEMQIREKQYSDRYSSMQEHEKQVASLEVQILRVSLCSEALEEKAELQTKHKEESKQLQATIQTHQQRLVDEQGQLTNALSELKEARLVRYIPSSCSLVYNLNTFHVLQEVEVLEVANEMDSHVAKEKVDHCMSEQQRVALKLSMDTVEEVELAQNIRLAALAAQCDTLQEEIGQVQQTNFEGRRRLVFIDCQLCL